MSQSKLLLQIPLYQVYDEVDKKDIVPATVLMVTDKSITAGPTWRQVLYATIALDDVNNNTSGITGRDLLLMTYARLTYEGMSEETQIALKTAAAELDKALGDDPHSNALVPKLNYIDSHITDRV